MLRCLFFIWKRCTVILKLDCSWRHDRITELPLPHLARALSFNFTLATCTRYILLMTCFHSLWATTNWSWCAKILTVHTELLERFLQINSILNLSIFPLVKFHGNSPRPFHHSSWKRNSGLGRSPGCWITGLPSFEFNLYICEDSWVVGLLMWR